MINFEKQFDNIESKFKEIENNLNNQKDLDTERLIKLNKELLTKSKASLAIKSVDVVLNLLTPFENRVAKYNAFLRMQYISK